MSQEYFYPQNNAYINGTYHKSIQLPHKEAYKKISNSQSLKMQQEESTEALKKKVQYLEQQLTELSKLFAQEGKTSHLIQEITLQNEQKINMICKLENKVSEMTQQIDIKQSQNKQLRIHVNNIRQEYQEKFKKLQNQQKLEINTQKRQKLQIQRELKENNIKLSEQIESLLSKIHILHKQFNEQQTQKQSLMQHIQQQNQFMEQMKDNLKDFTDENTYLKEEVSKVTQMSLQNQKQLQNRYIRQEISYKQEIDKLKREINETKLVLKNQQSQLMNKKNKIDEHTNSVMIDEIVLPLKHEIQSLTHEINKQKNKYKNLQKNYDQKLIQITQNSKKSAAIQLQKYKIQIKKLQNEKIQLNIKINKIQKDFNKLSYYQETSQIGQNSKEIIQKLEIQNLNLKNILYQLEKKIKFLQEDIYQKTKYHNERIQNMISSAEHIYVCTERDILNKKVQTLTSKVQNLVSKLSETQQHTIQLQCRYNTLQLSFQSEIQKNKNKENTLKSYQNAILQYQTNEENYRRIIRQFQQQIRQKESNIQRYQQQSLQLKSSQQQINRYEHRLAIKEEKIQQLNNCIKDLDNQNIKVNKEQFYRHKFAYEQLLIKYEKTTQDYDKLENEIRNYETLSNKKNKEATQIKNKQNDILKIDNSTLTSKNISLEINIEQLNKNYKTQIISIRQQYENKLQNEKNKIVQLNHEYQNFRNQSNIRNIDLSFNTSKNNRDYFVNTSQSEYVAKSQIKILQDRMIQKQRKIAQNNIEIENLRRNIEQRQDEFNKYKTQNFYQDNRSEGNYIYKTDIKHHPQVKKLQAQIVAQQRSIMEKDYQYKKIISQYQDENQKLKIENIYHRNTVKQLYAQQENLSTQVSNEYKNKNNNDFIRKFNFNTKMYSNYQLNSPYQDLTFKSPQEIQRNTFTEDLTILQKQNEKLKKQHRKIKIKLQELNEFISLKCKEYNITPRDSIEIIEKAIWLLDKISTNLNQYSKDIIILKNQKKNAIQNLNNMKVHYQQIQKQKIQLEQQINNVSNKLKKFKNYNNSASKEKRKNSQQKYRNNINHSFTENNTLNAVRSLPKLNFYQQEVNNNKNVPYNDQNQHHEISNEVANQISRIQQNRRSLLSNLKDAMRYIEK